MKLKNVKNIFLNKIAGFFFASELFSSKGHIYISFAIPRFMRDNYNWGDDINFILGEKLSGKKVIPYQYSIIKNHTNYLFIGSIIQWYCNSKSIIWGSGLIDDVKSLPKPKKVLAVRGPLTRNALIKCGIDCPEVYGDPAMLLPLIYNPKREILYKIGIILHYSERENFEFVVPKGYTKSDVLLIDIGEYGKWTDFLDKVISCEIILSSSLHGVIVSEAYNIPNLWTCFDHDSFKRKTFKYIDFYMSINKDFIVKPYKYDNLVTEDNLVEFVNDLWRPGIFDLNPLINACPFKFPYPNKDSIN
ncbi:polysaccharide pyruvyl transferase family protein [Zunongwangia sp. SCSIO 43204]|uniref:polysaccharide pyruvyl transferase family protein n=1 Tax=Zunongwangia sp. SCSIO 43204 TaxID=2779359 RepID=UPI001CAA1B4C|nr:polysaccharide pyruvyl transferase family protein [Zunongwangia sp. SCSIO 43204]UAB84828.1 polysaccharide pyruvyl transferase family protein [Zunongwangia sp. SCSIO 43204]